MGIALFVSYIHVRNLFACDTIFVCASADSAQQKNKQKKFHY